jgi:hypothetical protein
MHFAPDHEPEQQMEEGMSASEIAGSIAGAAVMVPVVIAYILGASMLLTGAGWVLAHECPWVPMARGRRCRKLMWERWGTVTRRNDYERVGGSMIEAYDVEWDADSEDEPNDAQDSVWRCHMRPEPMLKFLVLRAMGMR